MQTLVEGQTLLHDGRYRFLRRIGSGTFAVIMRALDVQRERHVAIKCVRQRELNALGEREAEALRRVNARDVGGACAVLRLLETFEEHGHFCLVLELLGPPVLDVARWGPWRHAPPGGARPTRRLKLFKLKTRRSSLPSSEPDSQSPDGRKRETERVGNAVSAPPLSLADVRQIAVHLCGALAFLHGQGLVHADVKPENVVRSSAEALGPSTSSPCSSPVKLVDFGNCLDESELVAYAEEQASGGFDVQTVTYRAPEVAAGLLLCSAMDMWSLGCLLLECASGKPLFTLPPLEATVQERAGVTKVENDHLLQQIECVVMNGVSLDATCAPYRSAARYSKKDKGRKVSTKSTSEKVREKKEVSNSLHARLEAAAPGNHQFHDFIYCLLDVNPGTRVTAKRALFHPFLQAFFPFGTVFAESSWDDGGRKSALEAATISGAKRKAQQSRSREQEVPERKRKAAERAASVRSKDLRQALKFIPRDVSRFRHADT